MEIFNLPRRMGGLKRLIRMSQDEDSAIVCSIKDMEHITSLCHKEDIDFPQTITYEDFISKTYDHAAITTVRIHNISALLEEMVNFDQHKIKIETATLITKTVTE